MNKCNCSEDLGLLSRCFSNLIALECIGRFYNAYRSKSLKLPESCSLNCPIECDIITYRIDQNYLGPMPNTYLEKYRFPKDLNERGAYMSFYYSNLEYTLLKEIPKTKPYDLVSNFGGTLGLFVGVSFISFVEIFEIIIEILFLIFKKNKVSDEVTKW